MFSPPSPLILSLQKEGEEVIGGTALYFGSDLTRTLHPGPPGLGEENYVRANIFEIRIILSPIF
jgi:hypothetical protein